MKNNDLANIFLRMLNRHLNEGLSLSQDSLWELAKRMAAVSQKNKKFQDIYNSPEGRQERNNIISRSKD